MALIAAALAAAPAALGAQAPGPAESGPAPAPVAAPELELRINLPAFRLEVVEGGEVVRSYPAAIGMPEYWTPPGDYQVTRIEWNPWWHPPGTPWARGEVVTPPGPGNPMGRAKIQFAGLLYVHGTALERELGTAASHGCIRIRNRDVLELARFLAERTGAAVSPEEITRLERSPGRTRSAALPAPLPLRVSYVLAEEVDGEIRVHEDVYGFGMNEREAELARRAGAAAGESAAPGSGRPPSIR